MKKLKRIENFENLKLGLFVHFGLYSIAAKGEWYMHNEKVSAKEYNKLMPLFKVKKSFAKDIVKTAKKLGAKYIVLTTRHHDGFSLYNTNGLTNYDIMHTPTNRDLVKEFVTECNKQNILPFFYCTLIDWHNPLFTSDFDKYLEYLFNSIKLLCTNYGKIGGFWFDGTWYNQNINWQFDKLFALIRQYQPDAIICNNGGLENRGEIIHPEIDSVIFERDLPYKASKLDNKYRAKEMCQAFNNHWGYCKTDKNYKTANTIYNDYKFCTKNNANLLINVGPKANGSIVYKEKVLINKLSKKIRNGE